MENFKTDSLRAFRIEAERKICYRPGMIKLISVFLTLLCIMPAPAAESTEPAAFNQQSITRLEGLLSISSPSGHEKAIQQFWLKHVAPKGDSQGSDAMGNVWVTFKSPDPKAPDLLIDAHVDEVGVQITEITPNGFLRVSAIGMPHFDATLCNMYQFMGSKGIVKGFAGASPAWWLMRDHPAAKNAELLFDVGAASADEAKAMGLAVGQIGTPATKPELLHKNRLMAHGLDCRINTFILMELADYLAKNKKDLKFNVTLLSSTQEEVGLLGGMVYCARFRPQLAIVIDTVLDTCQLTDNGGTTARDLNLTEQVMGKGPVVFTHNKIFDAQLTGQLMRLAEKNAIPVQEDPAFPPGMANFVPVKMNGGRAAFFGPAIRGMHSPREMCDLNDVKGVLDILKKFVTTEL